MKNPPILIAVIGFFAVLLGLEWFVVGARILGFDWFGALGDLPAFEQAGLWGWLAIAGGVIWVAVGLGLWMTQAWAWMFAMIMAGLSLFHAALYFFEYPGSGIGLAMSILPIILLFYLNSASVKAAFNVSDPQD
jgi:hypothetical protein